MSPLAAIASLRSSLICAGEVLKAGGRGDCSNARQSQDGGLDNLGGVTWGGGGGG
jgi:hypothetical protein